jgi:hypothetical protein
MLNSLSDDQIAQLGCVAVFFVSCGLTTVSYWLGGARKRALRHSIRMEGLSPAQAAANAALTNASRRKAA